MKKLPIFLLLALSFASAPPCLAKERKSIAVCEPAANLVDRSTGCTDNEIVFGEAAVVCLSKFEKDADAAGSDLARRLIGGKQRSAADAKSQEAFFEGTEKNLAETRSRLAVLIASGYAALTTDSFLSKIPCFEDNRNLLNDVAADFKQKIKDLEKARDVAGKMAIVAKNANSKLDHAEVQARSPANVRKVAAGPRPVHQKDIRNNRSSSDITGTGNKKINAHKPASSPVDKN